MRAGNTTKNNISTKKRKEIDSAKCAKTSLKTVLFALFCTSHVAEWSVALCREFHGWFDPGRGILIATVGYSTVLACPFRAKTFLVVWTLFLSLYTVSRWDDPFKKFSWKFPTTYLKMSGIQGGMFWDKWLWKEKTERVKISKNDKTSEKIAEMCSQLLSSCETVHGSLPTLCDDSVGSH